MGARRDDIRLQRRNPGRTGRRRGLTLLEVLLAIGLIAIMSGMMFAFYGTSLRTREEGSRTITANQLARAIALKIADEVRGANGFLQGAGPGISGDDRILRLQTVAIPDRDVFIPRSLEDDVPPAQSDIRQVQYYLAYDEDETHSYADGIDGPKPLGLVRREIRTLNQVMIDETRAEDVDLDLLAPEIKYIRFRYFDGVEWVARWDIGTSPEGGLGNSLPQAVEITVGYAELPPKEEQDEAELEEDPDLIPAPPEPYSPDSYTVMVRLPQADTFFGSRIMRAQRRGARGMTGGSSGGR